MKECELMVSVIVPVYNTGLYLKDCLCSVFNQTYPNIEIIIINDGSTDNSDEIINDIMLDSGEKNIRYIVQDNKGVSAARNAGIEEAKGKYLYFLDSDDVLELNAIEVMVEKMEETQSELFVFPCNDVTMTKAEYGCKNKENVLNEIFDTQKIGGYCWNKLFLRNIIYDKDIRFMEKIKYMEDEEFVYSYCLHINKAVCSSLNNFYQYRKREDSAMGAKKYTTYVGILVVIESILSKDTSLLTKETIEKIHIMYANANVWLNIYMFREGIYDTKVKDEYLSKAKLYYKYLTNKHKLEYWALKICPIPCYLGCRFILK